MPVRLWRVLLVTAVSGLITGCDEGSKDEAPRERPRLVSKEEIKVLEKKLLAEVAQIKGKKCPRPVLRGKPVAGSADADIVALVEGSEDLAGCR